MDNIFANTKTDCTQTEFAIKLCFFMANYNTQFVQIQAQLCKKPSHGNKNLVMESCIHNLEALLRSLKKYGLLLFSSLLFLL